MNATRLQQTKPGPGPTEPAPSVTVGTVDTRLAAVLDGKPTTDAIPLAAWWFVAESLRHSVTLRRSVEGVAVLSSANLSLATSRARTAAEGALDELSDDWVASGLRTDLPLLSSRSPCPAPLRITIRDLARLIVSPRSTRNDTLTAAISVHLEAIAAVHAVRACS